MPDTHQRVFRRNVFINIWCKIVKFASNTVSYTWAEKICKLPAFHRSFLQHLWRFGIDFLGATHQLLSTSCYSIAPFWLFKTNWSFLWKIREILKIINRWIFSLRKSFWPFSFYLVWGERKRERVLKQKRETKEIEARHKSITLIAFFFVSIRL